MGHRQHNTRQAWHRYAQVIPTYSRRFTAEKHNIICRIYWNSWTQIAQIWYPMNLLVARLNVQRVWETSVVNSVAASILSSTWPVQTSLYYRWSSIQLFTLESLWCAPVTSTCDTPDYLWSILRTRIIRLYTLFEQTNRLAAARFVHLKKVKFEVKHWLIYLTVQILIYTDLDSYCTRNPVANRYCLTRDGPADTQNFLDPIRQNCQCKVTSLVLINAGTLFRHFRMILAAVWMLCIIKQLEFSDWTPFHWKMPACLNYVG